MQHQQLSITYRPPAELKPYPGNARKHPTRQVAQLAGSMTAFDNLSPILIDENDVVLAGHGRLLAVVPTISVRHLTPAKKSAFRIADNRLAALAFDDKKALTIEFDLIRSLDIDFDLEITGFDASTIELLLDSGDGVAHEEPSEVLSPAGPPVTVLGDLWYLGRHRLVAGDATLRATYLTLMGRSRAQMVFCDPPYDRKMSAISGRGRIKHREFVAASGEMGPERFTRFLTDAMTQTARFSVDGAIAYFCMDWRHLPELHAAGAAAFDGQINLCVWVKNPGLGSLYRSAHELIAVYKRGTRPHINNVELGRHGRNRTNVWDYPGQANFSAARQEELGWHPTVKPVPLVVDAILDTSRRDGLVLDAFGGSGTTMLAAEQTGRQARLIELDPLYCDVIIRRFEGVTGIKAVDQAGRTFAERAGRVAADGETSHG